MKVILATPLCVLLFSVADAQVANRHNVFNIACHELKRLPFVDQESEAKELESLGIDGIEVHRKSYKLADEQIVFLGACDPKEEKPVVEDEYYGRYASVVRDFISYDVNGRVFAYRFTCYVVMTKNGFITTRAGAAGDVYACKESLGVIDKHWLIKENPNEGKLLIRTKPTVMKWWRDTVTFELTRVGDRLKKAKIESRPTGRTPFIDYGNNLRRVQKLMDFLQQKDEPLILPEKKESAP